MHLYFYVITEMYTKTVLLYWPSCNSKGIHINHRSNMSFSIIVKSMYHFLAILK